ncbi:hypothetical protein [Halegenticoccus soli]|uniref:hypothetical protein n=1 Tax=Halegenticoccus soli TaxID=1985678 RepID=UPI001303FFA9|nr:hypothetical protein [Halegenticoccus soli]
MPEDAPRITSDDIGLPVVDPASGEQIGVVADVGDGADQFLVERVRRHVRSRLDRT